MHGAGFTPLDRWLGHNNSGSTCPMDTQQHVLSPRERRTTASGATSAAKHGSRCTLSVEAMQNTLTKSGCRG